MMTTRRRSFEVNTSSMADIAFLLLTYFLMTTVIGDNKGLMILLPPPVFDKVPVPKNERNLFTTQINSSDEWLVEGKPRNSLKGLRAEIKEFILNEGYSKDLSESPDEAVVSIRTDRGTSYRAYIETLDEVQAAYFEIYSSRAQMSPHEFRNLDLDNPANKGKYDEAREGIPMNISIAEPTSVSKLE